MKHETINSIVGTLGLVIATIAAVPQFWPKPDILQVVAESRVDIGNRIEFGKSGLLNPDTGEVGPSFGPVTWKFRIYNSSNHAVSVVKFSVFQIGKSENLVQSNAFHSRLSPVVSSLIELPLPDTIGANQAKGYFFSLMVPYKEITDTDSLCSENVSSINQLQDCFFNKERDLFGNRIEPLFDDSIPPRRFGVSWGDERINPKFLVQFETADGSLFTEMFSYYPF